MTSLSLRFFIHKLGDIVQIKWETQFPAHSRHAIIDSAPVWAVAWAVEPECWGVSSGSSLIN